MFVECAVSLSVLVLCFLSQGCSNATVVDVDDVETVRLDNPGPQLRAVPVRCAVPMEGIYRGMAYDDYIFLLGMSWKTVYCVQKDTVISILEASGRGHGEYSSIQDFAYSPMEKLLYVSADGRLLKYSVPGMEFKGQTDLVVTPASMTVLNKDEILMNGSYIEDNGKDAYRGLCLVSSRTGKLMKKYYDLDATGKKMLMPWDLTQAPGGIVFPVNSFNQNSILFLDTADGSVRDLLTFSWCKNWRVPKRLAKLAVKDPIKYSIEESKETKHLEGVHFPTLIESGLSFWCFPREENESRTVQVLYKNNELIRRTYMIPGTGITPSPLFYHHGFCVDIVSVTDFEDVDESKLSPFGRELKRTVNAQPFDNPVLLYFKVD